MQIRPAFFAVASEKWLMYMGTTTRPRYRLTVNPEDAKQCLTVVTAMAIESWSAFATVAINEVRAGAVILAGVLGAVVDIYNDTKLAHLLIWFHTSLQRKRNIIRVPLNNERHIYGQLGVISRCTQIY